MPCARSRPTTRPDSSRSSRLARPHGDLASTAAMQLAQPLRKNPREVAHALVAALRRQPAVERWVEAIDIAGPGFINLRLGRPRASRWCARCCAAQPLGPRRRASASKAIVEFVSANPTGPLHVGHGRQAALGDALCNLLESQGWQVRASSITTTPACRSTPSPPRCRRGCAACARATPAGPNRLQRRLHRRHRADFAAGKTVSADDRTNTASGDPADSTASAASPSPTCATSRTSTCAPSACASTTTSSSRRLYARAASRRRWRASSPRARPTRPKARCGCARPTTATTRTA